MYFFNQSGFRRFSLVFISFLITIIIRSYTHEAHAQATETFPAGSFIVDMGVVPQTVGNALKPYGMIYDLIRNHGVPIKWIIEPTKGKDGIDFSHEGKDFRGGPFIISAPYRTTAVNSKIVYWQGQGVVGYTTVSPLTLPTSKILTLSSPPNWTLDYQNGAIALAFFANAGIPPTAYGGNSQSGWKTPSQLNDCDDIFVMPHADPTWATHSNLFNWNLNSKGSIWTGCHAGSALENLYNPLNPSQQMNFLSNKVTVPGPGIILPVLNSTNYAQNSLILWMNHSDGTPPYTYINHSDPVMQFMGIMDAATLNGSEQIFIPVNGFGSGWRSTTVTGVYDPDHPQRASNNPEHRAAVLAYGRAFGDPNRGYVMMQASHNIAKANAPANIAAQRAFFNFSFMAAKVKSPDPQITVDFPTILAGTSQTLSFSVQPPRTISEFTILWESSCGGSFTPNNAQSVTFTAPVVSNPITCNITITLTDQCGRVYKSTTVVDVICGLNVTTVLSPSCYGQNNGSIQMIITGASGPFVYNWTRSGGGSGSGTGTLISNLSPGTYTVTVTANNGAGCSKTFTVTIVENPQIFITATPVPVLCYGGSTGAINVTVTGGTPGYTYQWQDGPTTKDRSGLQAGTYTLTVTDSKGCTATTQATVTQPPALSATPSVTHVTCHGQNTGAISLNVSGGTPPYSFLWNDGSTAQNRTGLLAGNYSVVVTDANGCQVTLGNITVTQPSPILVSANASPILCNGGTTTIVVTASGGTGSLEYSLNGGPYQTSNTFSGIPASPSPYVISVRDANNCIVTTSLVINQPAPIVITPTITHPTCPPTPPPYPASPPLNSDGAVVLAISGGTPFPGGPPNNYTYSWTGPNGFTSTARDISNLIAGTYTVLVTDANGCTASLSVTLEYLNPNPVQPSQIDH